jgi:cobalt-zinc-cadmium efflux system membrane fusion protein
VSRNARIGSGIAGAIVVIAAIFFFVSRSRAPVTTERAFAPAVSLFTVREGAVEQTISLSGRVGSPAGASSKLSFAVAGSVASVDVTLGERVTPGQPLAQLDATPYALAASQAQAEAQAASQAAQAAAIDRTSRRVRVDEIDLERQQRLFQAGIVARKDVEAAQTALWADRGEAASARLQSNQARAQSRAADLHAAGATYEAARTTLRSPCACAVAAVYVTPGESVDTTTPAIALASSAQSIATLEVPAAQLAHLAAGGLVRLRAGDSIWTGRIAGVSSAVDSATAVAAASVVGVPANVPAGTPVDAFVVVRTVRGLVVPRDAIVEDPQTGAQLAFVRTIDAAGTPHFAARRVTVGVRDDRFANVTSGLHVGETIASSGAIDLLSPSLTP